MNMRKTMIGLAALALGGCAGGAGGPAPEMPEYFYQALFSSEMARTVARECGTGLTYDEAEWNARLPAIAERMAADGYDQDDTLRLLQNVPEDRLRGDVSAYIAENGLVAGQPQGFCATGRSEIAAESDIGSFLRTG